MRIENIDAFNLVGMKVRTKNLLELTPATAKVAPLWDEFHRICGSLISTSTKLYGAYTAYESDVSGEFDLVVSADGLSLETLQTVLNLTEYSHQSVNIEAGKYLIFSAKGKMPQTIIQLWGEVWRYFNAYDCEHVRLYKTDFECYKSETEVEIAIGIE
ncbi:GyrI-like domain-containing protein [uncultured Shewanella sp.]|uniref:GyrI-like domain-containing protein n=1 Tax=uncultured Shewanella sp. TaxID=173975 RepID=UPI00261FDEDD|nr:GyrI-like domain-containing protein [uncultured Shewanella sp.]